MRRRAIIFLSLLLLPGPVGATFSIVARDPVTQELGVAVQSRAFNVGMGVAWARAGVGAIATQAFTNESFGPRGLDLLGEGLPAPEVLERLLSSDSNPASRQVGIIDAAGRTAQHTGDRTSAWAGGRSGENYACQGNILAGEAVVDAMAEAFESTPGELSERLIAALVAAQAAGGDTRGQQSAALLVVRPSDRWPEYNHRYVDLRVDDHEEPIQELLRLYRILEGTDLARARIRYAEMFEEAGNPAAAEREMAAVASILRGAMARESTAATTLNAIAWVLCTHGAELETSLAAAQRAVALEPDSFEILDTLAEAHFRLGQYEKAVEVGARALALAPEDQYLQAQLERFRNRWTHLEPGASPE